MTAAFACDPANKREYLVGPLAEIERMAEEAKKDESKKAPGSGPWSPQWGRSVVAFTLLPTATWKCGSDMLQSGKVGRDGVTAMELHPLGVLVTAGKGEQQIVPAGSMTDIRLA